MMKSSTHKRRTRPLHRMACVFMGLCLSLTAVAHADYRILHHFTGAASDGATAYGSLIRSGSMLHGMTYAGGGSNFGTVFRMNMDGTGFQVLHSFSSAASDGQWPIGSLLLSGSTLYGMAASADSAGGGTLFRIGPGGADFQVLRRFSVGDGMWPWSSLMQSGSVLYGLNTYGGTVSGWNGKGTAFRINADGTGFRVLHTFAGGANDGTGPHGTFTPSGSTLYATTLVGGRNDLGTLFRMNPDGTGFQILHHFTGDSNDGARPYNVTLVPSGDIFYGMTMEGGSAGRGTVFRIKTDGTEFKLLHSFAGGKDGQKPFGSVILSGTTLYGMTSDENTGTDGTIFKINTDGTGFQVLHRFNGADGRDPCGSLLLSGTTLYGMTSQGGSQNKGVIFALDLVYGASFQGLGDLPGGDFSSTALGISADGSTIVGSGTTASGEQAFRWTKDAGMVSLGNLPSGSLKVSRAQDVSADGSVIVGYGDPIGSGWNTYKGFRWTQAGGMTEIGALNGSTRSMAFGVSADGSVVVGDGGQQAFRWTSNGRIAGLGMLSGWNRSRAIAVSDDGSVVIGSNYTAAWDAEQTFRWTSTGGMQSIAHPSGYTYSFPNALSSDGSVIAGSCSSATGNAAFRWSQTAGMTLIGNLPGRSVTHPGAVSAHGSLIVGGSYVDPAYGTAFLWDAAHGMRELQSVLQTECGLNLTGWTLQSASGMTPDGRIIVGWGTNPSGRQEAFRVEASFLPDPNGPIHNLSTGERFASLQVAVDYAQSGQVIELARGTYRQNVTLSGKNVTLQSLDPNDPNVTAATLIEGNGTDPVVKLQNNTAQCILAGLTIRAGGAGIWCSGGQPTIRSCQIIENACPGIELLAAAKPALDHCIIAANGGLGIKMPLSSGRGGIGGAPTVVNCTVAQNTAGGVYGGVPVIANSILYFNGAAGDAQIVPTGSQVTYSCVQGRCAGDGNFDVDPLFARQGRWTDPNDVNHPVPVWLPGDYHVQSQAGRWDSDLAAWVQDAQTSPCIDSGNPALSAGSEPVPNGGWLDLGAYGGTVQASKSRAPESAAQPNVTKYATAFSTYFGKSSGNAALAADRQGAVYVSGTTRDPNFPTTAGACCRTPRGESDVFVAKFSPEGQLVYSTLIGGSNAETGGTLKVNDAGEVYLAGTTSSPDFPTTPGAYDRTYDTQVSGGNPFLLKLDASGGNLIFSTFVPGNSLLQFDSAKNIVVTGSTTSATFPTTAGAYSRALKGGDDAYICKLSADGSQLLASTLFGGGAAEFCMALAVDQDDNIFIGGCSGSANFPVTATALKKQLTGVMNGFFAKFDPNLTTLLYSTFYAGSAEYNFVHTMFCTAQNKLYVTGQTYSTDVPTTANAYQSRLGGDADLYVTVFDPRTLAMPYSTYFGGNWEELAWTEPMGNDLMVAHGFTRSTNFPISTNAWRTGYPDSTKPFFSILDIRNPKASQLVYSSYLDADLPLTADEQGNIYLFGEISTSSYPVTPGAFQTQSPGVPAFVLTKLQPQ